MATLSATQQIHCTDTLPPGTAIKKYMEFVFKANPQLAVSENQSNAQIQFSSFAVIEICKLFLRLIYLA